MRPRAGIPAETGVFQTMMTVNIANDGPVTLIIDTPEREKES